MAVYTIISLSDTRLTEKDRERILAMGTEDDREEITEMLDEAEKIAHPRSAVALLPITDKDEKGLSIGGVRVENQLVAQRLSPLFRAFPCINTCGRELEEWSHAYASDPLAEYWADEIKKLYLGRMVAEAVSYMKENFAPEGHFSALNPGSLPEWPLAGQKQLFSILGEEDIARDLGVTLTPSMLMLPSKSTSGIWFESSTPYQNCMYCKILDCPNRRAPYREGEKATK